MEEWNDGKWEGPRHGLVASAGPRPAHALPLPPYFHAPAPRSCLSCLSCRKKALPVLRVVLGSLAEVLQPT